MVFVNCVNGQFCPQDESFINVLDLGLLRGYGAFDYVQVYDGIPFHLTDHLNRLKWSSNEIGLELSLELDAIEELTYEFIDKNELMNGGIRFIVTAGISKDQFSPSQRSNFFMLFQSYTPNPETYYSHGMRVMTTTMLRFLPSVKTTNYMPSVLAMKQAKSAGFDDALHLGNSDEILEGTTCNVFFIKNGKLIVPNSKDIVQGVTRNVLMKIASDHYSLEYRPVYLTEVESFDEAFLCSSIKDVVPLVQIDNHTIGSGIPGPITANLRQLYREYIANHITATREVRFEYCK